jgi:two-component system cell cycle sensor histidine kinase/response regulator CckA
MGTGLGLSVCAGIITELGGEISVAHTSSEGSVFRVVLPVRCVHQNHDEPGLAPTPVVSARVLVVDDEPLIGPALAVGLEGHDVVVVSSAREALGRITAEQFDVIFCDLLMPDMTGMDLFEGVRRIDPELARRFVFMTGGAFTPRAREFLSTITNPCLEKPFDVELVRQLLGLFAER